MDYERRWNLPPQNLLLSSSGRFWRGLAAEVRRHSAGELLEVVSDTTVVGIALKGNVDAVIYRRGDGVRQVTVAAPGTVWLCPRGVTEDSIRIAGTVPQMLHLYLPNAPFAALSREDCYPEVSGASIRYDAGFQDRWISSLAAVVLAELQEASFSGDLMIETAALSLAAWLLHSRAVLKPPALRADAQKGGLDEIRLRRVLEFIDANLRNDIALAKLASVACLSPFHFARAFKISTGKPPHRFIGDQRLQRAQRSISEGTAPLTEIAQAANFASPASFTRAFVRRLGLTPGAYRRMMAGSE